MNKFLLLAVLLLAYSCSSGDDGDDTITSPPQETFGDWSPLFSDQTSNFTQTRTGNQGTQQTRSITVNSESSTTTSTEEIINKDINDDSDLFDEVEQITITYSASDGLGAFQQSSTKITEDNDMGITIGNNFYSIKNGNLIMRKEPQRYYDINDSEEDVTCEIEGYTYTLYEGQLSLWAEEIQYSPNKESYKWSGTGMMIHAELFSYIDYDIALNDNKPIIYNDYMGLVNQKLGTSFNSQNSSNIETSDCVGYDIEFEPMEKEYENSCDVFNSHYSTNGIMWYDATFDSNYPYNDGKPNIDYCPGLMFDSQGKLVSISKNSDNIYTIKITGTDKFSLPVKIFYKGYLAIEIYED